MHRNRIVIWVGTAALATFVIAAVPAAAQTDQPADQAQPAAQAKPAQNAAPAAQPAAPGRGDGLALTEEQKTRIKALREQHQAEARTARETLRTAREELSKLQRAETFDERAFKSAAAAVATAQTDLMVQRARQRSQYLSVLTPEQRERAKVRRDRLERAERRARGFMDRRGNGWGQGRRGGMMGWGGRNQGWGWQGWGGRNQGWGPGPMGGPQGPWMMGPGGGAWGPAPFGPARRNWRVPPPPKPPAAPAAAEAPKAPKAPAAPAAPKK